MTQELINLASQLPANSQKTFSEVLPGFHSHVRTHATDFIGYIAAHMAHAREPNEVLVTQILGTPGSGKSFIAQRLAHALPHTLVLSTDDYNLKTREWRQNLIRNGGTAIQEKDFKLFRTHLDKLRLLRSGEKLALPSRYNPQTGLALENGLTRLIRGPVNHIVVDSNFFIGHKHIGKRNPDLLVYLHMDEATRLFVRCARDLAVSQRRAPDAKAIFDQMVTRSKTQDIPYTLPYMKDADVIAHVSPTFAGELIANMAYRLYEKK